jgi:hypothetical protein
MSRTRGIASLDRAARSSRSGVYCSPKNSALPHFAWKPLNWATGNLRGLGGTVGAMYEHFPFPDCRVEVEAPELAGLIAVGPGAGPNAVHKPAKSVPTSIETSG